jgi:DNA-binding FrmR family transcriptional regulator
MPNTPEEKRKAIMRLKRIRGQADGLIRAIEAETPCAEVLQQVAAMRGAVNGLMKEILESHLVETFGPVIEHAEADAPLNASIDQVVKLIHTYLK